MTNKEYISKLADFLISTNSTMNVKALADLLNWNNYNTTYRTEYKGERGTYTLIHHTYYWLKDQGLQKEADNVAFAFKKPDGGYAYEK